MMETMKQSGTWRILCKWSYYLSLNTGTNQISTFKFKIDLEVQGQWTSETIGILSKVLSISGPNLVIIAWTGDKLSIYFFITSALFPTTLFIA